MIAIIVFININLSIIAHSHKIIPKNTKRFKSVNQDRE